ncbi:MAG: 4Fe-4S dicluster domain-containing protein [Betaproteobacteria bacterium]|nr:4Fe-4S dicluster domain-containing protein [Betaproteobacteria bacterium]
MDDILTRLDSILHASGPDPNTGNGLLVRGGFHPEPADAVPALPDGRAAQTVVLIGNAGMALWHAFRAARPKLQGNSPRAEGTSPRAEGTSPRAESSSPRAEGRSPRAESSSPLAEGTRARAESNNPLEDWLDPQIEAAARAVGADQVIFPTRRPYPPVQRWAQRVEAVHPSPIGLLIHPRYGLFHVYRAVLLFAERFALPAFEPAASPCDSCADRPCLSVCPADAFQPERFDMVACVNHVTGTAGGNCRERGCLARRACPVGREFSYASEAGAFHMAAVVRAVRGMQRRSDGGGPDVH